MYKIHLDFGFPTLCFCVLACSSFIFLPLSLTLANQLWSSFSDD